MKTRNYEVLSAFLIRDGYDKNNEVPTKERLDEWQRFSEKHDIQGWEGWFLPEDDLYTNVLKYIEKSDVILDVGCGNLALDILLTEKCKKVYAIDLNPEVIKDALEIIGFDLPRNLIVVCGNALDFPIPRDVNTLVILMRHFIHEFPDGWLDIEKLIFITHEDSKLRVVKGSLDNKTKKDEV